MALETDQKGIEVGARELPLERCSDLLVVFLETQESIFDLCERGEVIRGEHLALDDGEIDLDLVEPAGMHWSVDRDHVAESGVQTTDASTATVRRAVVHDPEDAASGLVGWLPHHVAHQFLEGFDAGGLFAAAEELHAVNVHGGQVRPRPATFVLVLNTHGAMWSGRQGRMNATACLNAGLLVGRDDEIVAPQRFALPTAGIEVENAPRLYGKVPVAWKDPAPMLPGAKGIFAEPAPHRLVADGGRQSAAFDFAGNVAATVARQRQSACPGQFAGNGFNEHDHLWGEKLGADPSAGLPPVPARGARRTAAATDSPRRARHPIRLRSRRCRVPRRQGESSWRAPH